MTENQRQDRIWFTSEHLAHARRSLVCAENEVAGWRRRIAEHEADLAALHALEEIS